MPIRQRQPRLTLLPALLVLLSVSAAPVLADGLSAETHFDISPQSLDSALLEFSEQADIQLVVAATSVEGFETRGVSGKLSAEAALEALLENTGLIYDTVGTTVTVKSAASGQNAAPEKAPGNISGSGTTPQSNRRGAASPSNVSAGTPESTTDVGRLEEIIVTATKRPSSLRDVPISMSVFTGEILTDHSISNLEEMSSYEPNLKIADTSVTTNIYMRGIGSGLDRGFEQSVGLFVDGIYMGRSKQYRAPMLDVDRVEVLRGPQPVIFGKNTTAGAIQIETRKPVPGAGFGAEVGAEYELENDGRKVTGVLTGSPADTLGLRVAAMYEETDGFAENSYRNVDEPAVEQWVVRATGAWAPMDRLDVTAKFEHADFEYSGSLGEASRIASLPSGSPLLDQAADLLLFGPNGVFALDPDIDSRVNFRRSSDDLLGPQGSAQDVDNAAIRFDFDLDAHTLTAVLGYSAYEYELSNDTDFLPVPMTQQRVNEDFDQRSVEIRLASDFGGRFDYLAGIYWQENGLSMVGATAVNFEYLGPIVPLPDGAVAISSFDSGVNYGLETETASIFAQGTWRFTESARINLGVRYADESKNVDRSGFCLRLDGSALDPAFISDALAMGSGLCPTLASFTDQHDEDHFMPSVQVQWDVTSDVMTYAKWDRSYKSGGFNAATFATLADIEYDEETATGYEVGLKSSLADGAAVMNVALFHTQFDDLQVTTLTGAGQALLSNAGAATTRGVEIDGLWAVTEAFTLGGSAAYLDAKYDSYRNGPCNAVQRSAAVGSGSPCLQDLSGRTTSYAPQWTGHLFAGAEFPLTAGLNLRLRTDLVYSDDYFYDTDLDPHTRQDSYWKVDARVTLADAADRWDVSLLGKNLTNEAIVVWGTDIPLVLGSYTAFTELPRTVSLQARYRFGAQ